jgi:hypothetical protein
VPDPQRVDRGLAGERSDLAWNRSGLAVAACVVILLRRIWPLQGTGQVVALACISAGAAAWGLALLAGRAAAGGERRRLSTRRAGAITVGTLALALAALILGFFSGS